MGVSLVSEAILEMRDEEDEEEKEEEEEEDLL